VTAALMVSAALFTLVLQDAREGFNLLLSVGAGTGLLYLLRWYWWRINAWSEIAAMASSFLLALALFLASRAGFRMDAHVSLVLTVAATTAAWVVVTWLTPATSHDRLIAFYRLARPAGPGWAAIRRAAGNVPASDSPGIAITGWIGGCLLVYGALFGSGYALLGDELPALMFGAIFAVGALLVARSLSRTWTH
jgi:hypothetical protein